MRDATPRRHRWRITEPMTLPGAVFDRLRMLAPVAAPTPNGLVPSCEARQDKDEKPGADGIRHELVARIRREIAAGTYDTHEKWLAAEAELLRRIEERM